MGIVDPKSTSGTPARELGPREGRQPRRLSLLERVSSLLSPRQGDDEQSDEAPRGVDLAALRRRMTPPKRIPDDAFPSPRSATSSVASVSAFSGLPWPGDVGDSDWKPVVLSELEMIPAIPSLDELAEEGGIPPTEPRFPFDS